MKTRNVQLWAPCFAGMVNIQFIYLERRIVVLFASTEVK